MTPTEHAHMMKLREALGAIAGVWAQALCNHGWGESPDEVREPVLNMARAALSLPVPAEPTQAISEEMVGEIEKSYGPFSIVRNGGGEFIVRRPTEAFWHDARDEISRGKTLCAALQAALGVKP